MKERARKRKKLKRWNRKRSGNKTNWSSMVKTRWESRSSSTTMSTT